MKFKLFRNSKHIFLRNNPKSLPSHITSICNMAHLSFYSRIDVLIKVGFMKKETVNVKNQRYGGFTTHDNYSIDDNCLVFLTKILPLIEDLPISIGGKVEG